MTIPVRNVYYLLCYAWRHLGGVDLVDAEELDRMDHVHDLLGSILAEGTFRLVRRGVDRGYLERTQEVAGVRGKLEVGPTVKRALHTQGRTVCTVEEFSADVLHNRILRSTLQSLRASEGLDRHVREKVALAWDKLDGVTAIPLRKHLFRQVQLDRNQRAYRFLLSVCLLLFDSVLVGEGSGKVRFKDFRRDDNQMWRLFEDFALHFLQREQDAFRIQGQTRFGWADQWGRTRLDENLIPSMRPDVIAESPERRIILDTKFYREPLNRAPGGGSRLRSGHLYQIMAYLNNREARRPEGPRHEGILLYASVGRRLRAELHLQGFRVQARTVDLSRPWHEVREEMLRVLGGGGKVGGVPVPSAHLASSP